MGRSDPDARTTVVHGPAACGKSTNSAAIADLLGCPATVIDDWLPRSSLRDGHLHLTWPLNEGQVAILRSRGVRVLAFEDLRLPAPARA